MSHKPGAPTRTSLLLVGLVAGLLFLWSAKSASVTAKEPLPGQTIELSTEDLAEGRPQAGLPEVTMEIAGKPYVLELAATPDQARQGLMYRTQLAENHGMLFAFKPPRGVNFWMKNTRIPLDMVFLMRGQVVHVVQNAAPCLADPCPTYSSRYPVDMVVELPAGTVKKQGISIGASARLQSAIAPASPEPQSASPVSQP